MKSIPSLVPSSKNNSRLPFEGGEAIYTRYRATYPQDPLLRIGDIIDFGPIEASCANYHVRKSGHGITHSVPKLCRILFLKYWYGLSLRETEQWINGSIVGKMFCGYRIEEMCADHTIIGRFEQWVEANTGRFYFDEILRQIDKRHSREKNKIQKGDTFGVEANAARESLVRLIRHSSEKLLRAWGDEKGLKYKEEVLPQVNVIELFGPEKEKNYFHMTGEEREAQLTNCIKGALACLALSTGGKSADVVAWQERVNKILDDEVKISRNEAGEVTEVKKKSKKERGSYCIGSATDPDATYRVHDGDTTFGYNGSVLTDGEFVREIRADTGATADATPIPQMLKDQAKHHGLEPDILVYDKAAGGGKTVFLVAQATDRKTRLVAPMRNYDCRSERFTPRDFTLSDDGKTLTCPNGKETRTAYLSGSGEGLNYRFKKEQCRECPLWNKCRKSDKNTMKQVFISDYRTAEAKARAYEKTDSFKKQMRSRAHVERVIACLVMYCGARRMKRRGLKAADFQLKMSGMVFNVKRMLRKEALAKKAAKNVPAQKIEAALPRVDCV